MCISMVLVRLGDLGLCCLVCVMCVVQAIMAVLAAAHGLLSFYGIDPDYSFKLASTSCKHTVHATTRPAQGIVRDAAILLGALAGWRLVKPLPAAAHKPAWGTIGVFSGLIVHYGAKLLVELLLDDRSGWAGLVAIGLQFTAASAVCAMGLGY